MRVVVTGGAGFIGSHLVRVLAGKGWNVVLLDDISSGKLEHLGGIVGSHDLKIVKGDVRDRKVVAEALIGVDAVVHLAAFVSVPESVKKPLEAHDINVNGTLNVLDACVKKSVRRFVFASSAAVYGEGNPLPLREEYELRPASPYAASKVSGEYYSKVFRDCYGLNSVVMRFFNVYGPGQGASEYASVMTKFVHRGLRGGPLTVYGDGSQTRDFVNIEEVVEAIVKALTFKPSKDDVFNICSGKPISIDDVAHSLCNVLGKNLPVKHVDPRAGEILHSHGDPAKAQKVLGFQTHVRFEDGLASLVESMRQSS